MLLNAHDVQARLSDLVETTLREGPQVVCRNGVEAAVIVPIEEWKRLRSASNSIQDPPKRSLKDILLDPNGPHDIYIPPRRQIRLRPLVDLE